MPIADLIFSNATAANGSGTATVTIPAPSRFVDWLVSYLVVSVKNATTGHTSTALVACLIYESVIDLAALWDGATSANSAIAAYSPPRPVPAGRPLICVFAGANPGDICSVRCEFTFLAAS